MTSSHLSIDPSVSPSFSCTHENATQNAAHYASIHSVLKPLPRKSVESSGRMGWIAASLLCAACGPSASDDDSPSPTTTPPAADAFADRVVSFEPGQGAGFGQEDMPDIVLGPPVGGGQYQGSIDVVSLGAHGSIVVAFDDLEVIDGEGIDLLVFENVFEISGGGRYMEPGEVSVSPDGVNWSTFPCQKDASPYEGCAGLSPVYASVDNDISALDPSVAGGDGFDLATVGLTRARYVRIVDAGVGVVAEPTTGFDLDAVAAIHATPVQSE